MTSKVPFFLFVTLLSCSTKTLTKDYSGKTVSCTDPSTKVCSYWDWEVKETIADPTTTMDEQFKAACVSPAELGTTACTSTGTAGTCTTVTVQDKTTISAHAVYPPGSDVSAATAAAKSSCEGNGGTFTAP